MKARKPYTTRQLSEEATSTAAEYQNMYLRLQRKVHTAESWICCKQHAKDGFNKALNDGPDATSFSRKGSLVSCKRRKKCKHATDSLVLLPITKNLQKQSLPENIELICHTQPTQ